MPSSLITAKGQTTIPKAIRDRLRVGPGDRVDFVVQPDGTVTVEPALQGVAPLKGLLARKGRTAGQRRGHAPGDPEARDRTMIGLDTNVLVRYLMQDDAAQARLASTVIESAAGRGERLRLTPSPCASWCGCWSRPITSRGPTSPGRSPRSSGPPISTSNTSTMCARRSSSSNRRLLTLRMRLSAW